jgi:DUF2934 family protein
MGREIQERILARAHAIWVAHGCQAGCDAEYRDQASREVAQDEQLRGINTSDLLHLESSADKLRRITH